MIRRAIGRDVARLRKEVEAAEKRLARMRAEAMKRAEGPDSRCDGMKKRYWRAFDEHTEICGQVSLQRHNLEKLRRQIHDAARRIEDRKAYKKMWSGTYKTEKGLLPKDRLKVEPGTGLVQVKTKHGYRHVTGDIDLFGVLDQAGHQLSEYSPTYKLVVNMLMKGPTKLEHGAHLAWRPFGDNIKVFKKIVKQHLLRPIMERTRRGAPRRRMVVDEPVILADGKTLRPAAAENVNR